VSTYQIDPPSRLPVDHLSVSSLSLLARCPQAWFRRYILNEYEPPAGRMLLGSAVHAAEAQHYGRQLEDGIGLTVDEVADEFSDEWDERIDRAPEVEWGGDRPGELKDSGVLTLRAYHSTIAPDVTPVAVERKFELAWPGVDWTLLGFLDLETDDGAVNDYKVIGRKMPEDEPLSALQPSAYLYARRAEGDPATEFRFHNMVRTKQPYAQVVPAHRTDRQLDAFCDRVFMAASEIAWRLDHDVWSYAPPGSWWCSKRSCPHYAQCPGGGLR
jgi:PD-(D/E)XK nuclease superfamily